MKLRFLGFIISSILLVGCIQNLESFVSGGGKRGEEPVSETPSPSSPALTNTQPGYKITAGANVVVGTQLKSQFALAPSQRSATGTQLKSVFSLNAHRAK